ncbi:MAG: carbamoyltransferase HypF [Acidimicrobiales bacterium]
MSQVRQKLEVRGVVQGVGFRPFVHRVATEYGLCGFVRNEATHVRIEVEGSTDGLTMFRARLLDDLPRLARIDAIDAIDMACSTDTTFRIDRSGPSESGTGSIIPPDTAVCFECVREMFDPDDRRHRHPFTTCTNCGPRFTIIDALPYDRLNTTMDMFNMCRACAVEYGDPANRRHHAQPIACPDCGPRLAHEQGGQVINGTDAVLSRVHADLSAGLIVAIKGLGGYHLAVDARNDDAVTRLRSRKSRVDKPFAVMVPNLDGARQIAEVDDDEASALESPAHPIVLLRAVPESALSAFVSPGNPLVGVMLPYTPLHHLLFAPVPDSALEPPSILVMTSGNLSEEPICFDDEDARHRLAPIADSFCSHDRPIRIPCDDSVIRLVDGRELPIRRSRGYAPLPVPLPISAPPTLAVGGELKNTFALAMGSTAWLSQHVGDMENHETLRAFESSVERLSHMYAVQPDRVAVDSHPGYRTHRWATRMEADRLADVRRVEVQHHHAHLAALMAEHGIDERRSIIGFVFDGTGLGTDGTMWGGEVLLGGYRHVTRWGHVRQVPLPGGDSAAQNPCRTALAHLRAAGIRWDPQLPSVRACSEAELRVLARQLDAGVNCVSSSSMGRLFDAAASILDLRHRITYEAQAAINLEALAENCPDSGAAHLRLEIRDGMIDPTRLLVELVSGMKSGLDRAALARGFHDAVAEAIAMSAVHIRTERAIDVVGLTGGVFQNVLLTRLATARLMDLGFDVLTHRVVPPNDGGIALGQLMVAAHHRADSTVESEGSEPLCV